MFQYVREGTREQGMTERPARMMGEFTKLGGIVKHGQLE